KELTLRQFDDLYTAPRSGFRDAAEYYEKASSFPLLGRISVPALIAGSADDPMVETASYREIPEGPGLDVVLTPKGGHVGFVGSDGTSTGLRGSLNVRWMDTMILKWMGVG